MSWFGRSPRSGGTSFEKRPSPTRDVQPQQEQAPAPSARDEHDEIVAYLYKGSRVTGQLTFHGPARVDGSVDGEIQCRGKLTIGEGARVRANISGDEVVIHGEVEGDVTAKNRVELSAPARLQGNIDAPRLVIAEGVVFDGDCAMGGSRARRSVPNPQSSTSDAFDGGSPKLVTTLEK